MKRKQKVQDAQAETTAAPVKAEPSWQAAWDKISATIPKLGAVEFTPRELMAIRIIVNRNMMRAPDEDSAKMYENIDRKCIDVYRTWFEALESLEKNQLYTLGINVTYAAKSPEDEAKAEAAGFKKVP